MSGAAFGLGACIALAWLWIFEGIHFTISNGDRNFWVFSLTIFSVASLFAIDGLGWKPNISILAISGITSAIYFTQLGYWDYNSRSGWRYLEVADLSQSALWGITGTFSVGILFVALAEISYLIFNKMAPSLRRAKQNQSHFNSSSFGGGDDDGAFDYDENAFRGQSSTSPPEFATFYGADKRHPDDVALWNKVDDPSASTEERRSTFDMIMKREAKRKK